MARDPADRKRLSEPVIEYLRTAIDVNRFPVVVFTGRSAAKSTCGSSRVITSSPVVPSDCR
ncbi:MAG: hypothetical protein WDM77_12230 [Steroidobacteraceae bacterium]